MKQITIRECAFRACQEAGCGREMLFEVVREAFTGDRPDWDSVNPLGDGYLASPMSTERGLYEAIAPDVFASVSEEPTTQQVFENVCDAIGERFAKISESDI